MGDKMSLIRMRECLSLPNKYYKTIDVPENLKESFNLAVKTRIKESVDTNNLISEIQKLQESASSDNKAIFDKIIKKLKEEGVTSNRKLWKFPISRINTINEKNGNGRVYSKKLWENVINNQQDIWKGGIGLCDHPVSDDDAGEFKNTAIVWLGMELDELNNLVWGLGVFVGMLGALAQEVIEAGGRVGFSSSGFGELMSDGCTVNPDTYQIERVADIVTNPSQSVFGSIQNDNAVINDPIKADVVISEKPLAENKEVKENTLKESVAVNPKSKIIQNIGENMASIETLNEDKNTENKSNTILSKLEKVAIEKYVESFQSDIKNIKNPVERLNEINKLLDIVKEANDEKLNEKVNKQLLDEKKEVEKLVNEAMDLKESFNSELPELKENVQNLIINESENKKETEKKFKSYKKLSEELTSRNRQLYKENTLLKSRLKLKERGLEQDNFERDFSMTSLNMKISELEEKLENAHTSLREERRKNRELNSSNEKLEKKSDMIGNSAKRKMTELQERIESMSNTLIHYKKLLSEAKENNKQIEESADIKSKHLEEKLARENKRITESSEREIRKLNKENKSLKESVNSKDDEISQLKEQIENLTSNLSRYKNKVGILTEKLEKANKDFEEYKENQKIENHIAPTKTDMIVSKSFFRENQGSEVEQYWNDLKNVYGDRINPFEKSIRGAKTYREAFNNFLKNKDAIDESFERIKESTINPEITSKTERKRMLKEAGMEFSNPNNMSVDELNDAEYERMKQKGFI